jgi:hypothetical protein
VGSDKTGRHVRKVRRVAVKRGVHGSWGGKGFDGFITKVGGDGFPSSAIVAFQSRE